MYAAIQRQLQGYFDQVMTRLKTGERAQVAWCPAVPDAKPDELVVYFTSTDFSAVAQLDGVKFDPLAASHWGFTRIKSQNGKVTVAASEVYARMLNADVLAKLAFHECMHNKLAIGNELHSRNGLAAATVGEGSRLTAENVADMAAALRNPVPQWREGAKILVERRQRRDAGDPVWNI
jgi:hypothetical protein